MLLDVDDVLADFSEVLFQLAKERYGVKMERKYYKKWSWIFNKLGKRRALTLFNEIWSSNSGRVEPLEPNLGETVAEMRKVARVVVATGRQNTKDTLRVLEWLGRHNIGFDGFASVNLLSMKKDDFLRYDAIIDDAPPNIEAAMARGMFVFTRDQPWNTHIPDGRRSRRISRLSDAVKHLKHIETYGELKPYGQKLLSQNSNKKGVPKNGRKHQMRIKPILK